MPDKRLTNRPHRHLIGGMTTDESTSPAAGETRPLYEDQILGVIAEEQHHPPLIVVLSSTLSDTQWDS
jgi:hypothetical protein